MILLSSSDPAGVRCDGEDEFFHGVGIRLLDGESEHFGCDASGNVGWDATDDFGWDA